MISDLEKCEFQFKFTQVTLAGQDDVSHVLVVPPVLPGLPGQLPAAARPARGLRHLHPHQQLGRAGGH